MADPRKFRDYVVVPGHPSGKDHIFLDMFGFRPRSAVDAWELARLCEQQARERIAAGEVRFAGTISFGHRMTIVVVVREVPLRTRWLLGEGVLRLIAPFSVFARSNRKGETMPLPELSAVRLATDRYRVKEGVGKGAIGFILDVFDDAYIVEFSRPDGTTIAWFDVKPEEVVPPEVQRAVANRSTSYLPILAAPAPQRGQGIAQIFCPFMFEQQVSPPDAQNASSPNSAQSALLEQALTQVSLAHTVAPFPDRWRQRQPT